MAALFDVGVICGNMAASHRHGMTSRWKKKFETSARGAGFYPFALRRPAEEMVGKSNLSFAASPPALCSIPVAAATRSEMVKPALITFLRNKEERRKKKGKIEALGRED